eukprot:TRINITY_DN2878_c0_g1_i1.p1 TRINITY_DN2878_c0_g1~~TRINITY_DN2878_c0_g1_i1.p1  ORF type:complete len:100 (-),score=50.54 TRINITY_DN2878_c0_g1_i1:123-422(-)
MIFFFLMIRRPPRSTQSRSSAASDVYKRQLHTSLHFHKACKLQDQTPTNLLLCKKHISKEAYLQGCQIEHLLRLLYLGCLLYTSPSPRDRTRSRMPSSA